ncbi:hypothetical protein [Streptomyces capillispiralis]|nr:hypothetical protein [Streptomyces capillispiralis]
MKKYWRELPEQVKKERADNHSERMRDKWKKMPLEEASRRLEVLAAASKAAHAAPVDAETTRQTVRELMGAPRYAWMASTSTATTPLAGAAALSARPEAPKQGSGSRAPQTPGPGTSQAAAPGRPMTPSLPRSHGR